MESYVHRRLFRTKLNICNGALLLFWSIFFLQKCSLVNVWLGSKYPTGSVDTPCKMVPLVLFCNIYVIISSSFVFENENITLKNIWLLISQWVTLISKHHLHKTTFEYRFSSKSKVTKNIFNLQEWHQNTQNYKSLFLQIFIVYKTFAVGKKTKNLPRTTRFSLRTLYKGDL